MAKDSVDKNKRLFLLGGAAALADLAFAPAAYAQSSGSTRSLNRVERRRGSSALAIEYETGRVLYEHNANAERIPASLIKILADMVIFDAIRENPDLLQQVIRVPRVATNAVRREGESSHRFLSHHGIFSLSVEDALQVKILQSMNEPAIMLAIHIAGSEEAFVERMQAKADEIGLTNTALRNSTGYNAAGQVSTAHDMAKAAAYLIRYYDEPGEYQRYSMRTARIAHKQLNTFNRFLSYADDADGIKTGRLNICGSHNLGSAFRDEKRVISIVMGADRNNSAEAARANQQLMDLAFLRHSVAYPGLEPPRPYHYEVQGEVAEGFDPQVGERLAITPIEQEGLAPINGG